jgi:hypothetical protein
MNNKNNVVRRAGGIATFSLICLLFSVLSAQVHAQHATGGSGDWRARHEAFVASVGMPRAGAYRSEIYKYTRPRDT